MGAERSTLALRLEQARRRVLPHGPVDAIRQVLLFAAAYYAYRLSRGAIDDPQGATMAFDNARTLMRAEQHLGLFVEPTVQEWSSGWRPLLDAASWIYINAQSTVVLSALAFIYVFHNERFYFVRNMFVVAMALALVGYLAYPTAPPRFFPEWGFEDSVAAFTGIDAQDAKVDVLFNPYAAVPSMHVCVALILGWSLSGMCRRRAARAIWAIYPLVMVWVVLATANHWTLDALLGAVTAAASFSAARALARARPAAWAFGAARVAD